MATAGDTGQAARPLPLFYALSQAGKAILAVRGDTEPRSHGLSLPEPQSPVLKSKVHPQQRRGAFQAVCDAVDSPSIHSPVELGALLCSLPELANAVLPTPPGWPLPALVWPDSDSMWTSAGMPVRTAVVLDDQTSTESVRELLQLYPVANETEWHIMSEAMRLPHLALSPTPAGNGVIIDWKVTTVDQVAPEYRWFDRRWLRPAVETTRHPPSPLMTWWALLFGMSVLARYHPAEWTQALNVDRSSVAVPLQHAMEEALRALPQLVLEGLVSQPILTPSPEGL